MPLYEYECDVCAHRFELIQKFTDPPPAACPRCGGAVTKLLSSPAIQFKGSGFYLTDYGRSGSKGDNANVKSGKNDSGSSSSESTSSDSKSSESKSSDSGTSAKSDSGGSSSDSAAKPAKPAKPATPAKAD